MVISEPVAGLRAWWKADVWELKNLRDTGNALDLRYDAALFVVTLGISDIAPVQRLADCPWS